MDERRNYVGCGSLSRVSVLHYAGLKPWIGRASIGRQSIKAFDAAMASYRTRCFGRQARLTDPERLFREMAFQQRHKKGGSQAQPVGKASARIHLRDLYAYGG